MEGYNFENQEYTKAEVEKTLLQFREEVCKRLLSDISEISEYIDYLRSYEQNLNDFDKKNNSIRINQFENQKIILNNLLLKAQELEKLLEDLFIGVQSKKSIKEVLDRFYKEKEKYFPKKMINFMNVGTKALSEYIDMQASIIEKIRERLARIESIGLNNNPKNQVVAETLSPSIMLDLEEFSPSNIDRKSSQDSDPQEIINNLRKEIEDLNLQLAVFNSDIKAINELKLAAEQGKDIVRKYEMELEIIEQEREVMTRILLEQAQLIESNEILHARIEQLNAELEEYRNSSSDKENITTPGISMTEDLFRNLIKEKDQRIYDLKSHIDNLTKERDALLILIEKKLNTIFKGIRILGRDIVGIGLTVQSDGNSSNNPLTTWQQDPELVSLANDIVLTK